LDLRERKWQEAREGCIMKSFINLYASTSIIRVINSRRLRWEGHVTCMVEMRNAYKFWLKT